MYVKTDDLIKFLVKARDCLTDGDGNERRFTRKSKKKGGLIFIKENVQENSMIFDETDHSFMRTDNQF